MSEIRILNGATVSRIWRDSEAEFLAAFQYSCDARDFAQARIARDAEEKLTSQGYVVADLGSGRVTIFRPREVQA